MRSRQEITFRLRQEIANALLAISSPDLKLKAELPLAILPDPAQVAKALRDTQYARDLIATADEILLGRIPILGQTFDYGPQVAWRKDPYRGTETPARYFRRIPYLDVAAAGDHKFIWEVNRHQHLVLLAQAAVLTGEAKYSDHVFRQLEHWWSENSFQRGINWTSALEVGFRALSWVWIFHLIGNQMAPEFRQRFVAVLYRHGLHLENNLSIYFSPNTHLLGEAVALHALGRLFPQWPRSEKWNKRGSSIVSEHMERKVYWSEDGSYFEKSTYYHMYALDMFAFHAVLGPVSASFLQKLSRMGEFLASVVNQPGELPSLGDDDGGRFFHPYGARPRFARASLAVVSVLAGKSFFQYDGRDLAEIAMWWLCSERCTAALPEAKVEASIEVIGYPGLVTFRKGQVVALFDASPFGPGSAGHSHSDTLSLVVSVANREVLIDSGTFSYMDSEWRAYFRGSSAHNTVRIDGSDQALPAGPFRWAEKPLVRMLLEDSEEGSKEETKRITATCAYRSFLHQRTVEFSEAEFRITDQISGPTGEHVIEQFWHFAIEPSEVAPDKWVIGDMAEFNAEGGTVEQSWRSRCFGTKEPAWTIVVHKRAALPLTLQASLHLKK
jgi:hypothetical protein